MLLRKKIVLELDLPHVQQPILNYRTGKMQKLTNQENLPQPVFRTRVLPAILPQYRSIVDMQKPLLSTVDVELVDVVPPPPLLVAPSLNLYCIVLHFFQNCFGLILLFCCLLCCDCLLCTFPLYFRALRFCST